MKQILCLYILIIISCQEPHNSIDNRSTAKNISQILTKRSEDYIDLKLPSIDSYNEGIFYSLDSYHGDKCVFINILPSSDDSYCFLNSFALLKDSSGFHWSTEIKILNSNIYNKLLNELIKINSESLVFNEISGETDYFLVAKYNNEEINFRWDLGNLIFDLSDPRFEKYKEINSGVKDILAGLAPVLFNVRAMQPQKCFYKSTKGYEKKYIFYLCDKLGIGQIDWVRKVVGAQYKGEYICAENDGSIVYIFEEDEIVNTDSIIFDVVLINGLRSFI